MKRLIECVPNFSEGRERTKVEAIVAAMNSVPGVYVLDREMDADHNRSVVTLAGGPGAGAGAGGLGKGAARGRSYPTKDTGGRPRGRGRGAVPLFLIAGGRLGGGGAQG